jgi:hypothetical protein
MLDKLKSMLGGIELISKRKALKMLQHYLQEAVNHEIKKFQMTFDNVEKKVDFLVYYPDQSNYPEKYNATPLHPAGTHLYKMNDGNKLVDIIMSTINDEVELPENSSLDKAVMIWHEIEPIELYFFYTLNNEKKSIKQIML